MKKFASKLLNQQRAGSIAHVLRFVCYFVMAFYVFCLILSVLGRQSFTLHANGKSYDDAILAEENHDTDSHILTVSTTDSIHVAANQDGQIDPAIRIGLVLIYAVSVVPWILAFWLLGRVFTNVSDGLIFTEQNASYLSAHWTQSAVSCTASREIFWSMSATRGKMALLEMEVCEYALIP